MCGVHDRQRICQSASQSSGWRYAGRGLGTGIRQFVRNLFGLMDHASLLRSLPGYGEFTAYIYLGGCGTYRADDCRRNTGAGNQCV